MNIMQFGNNNNVDIDDLLNKLSEKQLDNIAKRIIEKNKKNTMDIKIKEIKYCFHDIQKNIRWTNEINEINEGFYFYYGDRNIMIRNEFPYDDAEEFCKKNLKIALTKLDNLLNKVGTKFFVMFEILPIITKKQIRESIKLVNPEIENINIATNLKLYTENEIIELMDVNINNFILDKLDKNNIMIPIRLLNNYSPKQIDLKFCLETYESILKRFTFIDVAKLNKYKEYIEFSKIKQHENV